MEALGELLVKLVPVAIPIILIWSFMVNHGFAPDGSESKQSKKSEGKEGDKSTEASKPTDNGGKGPEG